MSVRPTTTGRDSGPIEDPDAIEEIEASRPEIEIEDDRTRTEDGGVTKRRIGPLLGRRRRNLNRDAHITSDRFDHWREADDHKIRRVVIKKKNESNEVVESDLTALEGAASSTTTNLEVLVIEAEQAAEIAEASLRG